jgi:hypothetical protein
MTGQFKTQIVEVEGPIAYLETTTSMRVNYENATRSFEIYLDESEDQTLRIQSAQRRSRMPVDYNREERRRAIQRRHHHAQKLLEPVQIGIPYAELITFPSHRLRCRRDHERFLSLIEASAFLHQHQRERGVTGDGTPYVLASPDDYAVAYTLAKDVLTGSLHELTHRARELWETVRDWVAREAGGSPDFGFTRRELLELTGLEQHRLRDALDDLVDMEYLEVVSGGKGKQMIYRLLVHDQHGVRLSLLTPQELSDRLARPPGGPGKPPPPS